jgi:alkylhydroperoxidase family enzyme
MAQVHIPDDQAHDPFGFALTHYAPELGAAGGGYAKAVYQSSRLPLRVLEAARYRTAEINGCQVCQGFRAATDVDGLLDLMGGDPSRSIVARGGPAPDEAFYGDVAGWRTATRFSDQERLAIEYAERMGEQPKSFESDLVFWQRMHAAFSDAEIFDLTLAIGAWIGLGRVTHVLELDTVCARDTYARASA